MKLISRLFIIAFIYITSLTANAAEVSATSEYASAPQGLNLDISVDPISFSRRDDEREIDYDVTLSNNNKEKYDFQLEFDHENDSSVDRFTDIRTSSNDADLDIDFSLTPKEGIFSYTSHYSYERSHEGNFYDKRADITFAPLGLKALFVANKNIVKELSLSYLPHYHYLKHDLDYPPGETRIERSARHWLSLRFKARLSQNVHFKSKLDWTYIDPKDSDIADQTDRIVTVDVKLSYKMNERFSVGYHFEWERDSRQKRLFNEDFIESTHSFRLIANFDIFKN